MPLPSHLGSPSRQLPLVLRRVARARRMTLRLNPLHDRFELTLPPRCQERIAERFLEERALWITTQLRLLPRRIQLRFGEEIPVLGRTRLIVPEMERRAHEHAAPLGVLATPGQCEKALTTQLERLLQEYIEKKAYPWALALGVARKLGKVTLRDVASRWGSCSPDGRLMFSWRLVFAPRAVLDYVILHEVVHLRHLHHGPEYWRALERLMPDYDTHRQWLKRHGTSLYRYGRAPR